MIFSWEKQWKWELVWWQQHEKTFLVSVESDTDTVFPLGLIGTVRRGIRLWSRLIQLCVDERVNFGSLAWQQRGRRGGKRSWALCDSLMTRSRTGTTLIIICGFSDGSESAGKECGLVDKKEQQIISNDDRMVVFVLIEQHAFLSGDGVLCWNHLSPADGAVGKRPEISCKVMCLLLELFNGRSKGLLLWNCIQTVDGPDLLVDQKIKTESLLSRIHFY